MIKKIDVLGIELDHYTVREAMLQVDTFMNNNKLNIIETVSMDRILLAADNKEVGRFVQEVDLSVVEDSEILLETGNASPQMIREVRTHDFLNGMLGRIIRSQKKVFLIAMTRAEVEKMTAHLTALAPTVIIEKSYAIEECTGDMDAVVNEINAATPDIVLSAMTTPYEEEFLISRREKICGSVWLGIGADYFGDGAFLPSHWWKKLMQRLRLHARIMKYKKEKP